IPSAGKPSNIRTQRSQPNYLHYLFEVSPIIVSMTLCQPFLVKKTSLELSTGLKELMIINGVSGFSYWFSSFWWSFIMMLLGALPAVSVARVAGVIMKKSDILVLLLGAVLHCASTVLFCLVIASVVPRPSVGLVVMSFILFATLIIPFVLATVIPTDIKMSSPIQTIISLINLIPNVAWSYMLANVTHLENIDTGAQLWNMNKKGLHSLTVYRLLNIMGGSCLISTILTWYLSNIWPYN
ncbi:unnamed protein product, partial [Ixodes pacificus]